MEFVGNKGRQRNRKLVQYVETRKGCQHWKLGRAISL